MRTRRMASVRRAADVDQVVRELLPPLQSRARRSLGSRFWRSSRRSLRRRPTAAAVEDRLPEEAVGDQAIEKMKSELGLQETAVGNSDRVEEELLGNSTTDAITISEPLGF
ncbi:uncharacterized protein A4U43_C08F12980 [Asparagus officinalis]|nr:uncharacterized protein A4U43_C08F12980 [Asparagus officinalis]